ncbi:Colicin I receptor precursor [Aliarcobacter thereius]|uniref:Colicin I receptor n=1 Tax=Aliarcobacter thereius TaxID=544718 RepID=A0A1C0B684_9BACT|nr:TonB-dependent receptor [Aliarcobacter thereius]OCL98620.1 Colicin I receptor precursor [Aliarcobacter thereius]
MKIKMAISAAALLLTQNMVLANDTTKLDDVKVVTSASGFEQNIADAAASISVITAEELEKRSYTDVTDALKNVPGINVNGNGSNKTISIRGMGSEYTLFLIDGKPAQSGEAYAIRGGIPGAQMNYMPPLEAIERIEIIRGPASSLYGSDAIGGVINIITKKHMDKATASIRTEYIKADKSNKVNNTTSNTTVYINSPIIEKVLSFQFDAGILNTDESNYSVQGADSEFDRKNATGKIIFTPDDNNTIRTTYSYSIQERLSTAGKSIPELNSMGQANSDSYTKTERNSYSVDHEGKYDRMNINSYVNYEKDKSLSQKTEFETIIANTQGTYFFDTNSLTIGANYKKEKLSDDSSNAAKPNGAKLTELERYQWSLFAENTWQTTDDLAITLSGRYDDNEQFGSNFSPKAYAVYSLTDNLNLKGGITTGYKAPSLRASSDDFATASMGGAMIGNPDLEAEKSTNYEAGVSYDNSDLGLAASLMIFQIDFKDKLLRSDRFVGSDVAGSSFYVNNPHLPYNSSGYTTYYNVDKAQSRGLELTTEYDILENLKYRHSYTFNDTEQKSGSDKGRAFTDTPKHMFNVGLDWEMTSKLLLWTQVNYNGKTSGSKAQGGGAVSYMEKKAYTLFDVGTVYNYDKNLQFSAGIYNLTNKKNDKLEAENRTDQRNLDGRRFSFAMNMKF